MTKEKFQQLADKVREAYPQATGWKQECLGWCKAHEPLVLALYRDRDVTQAQKDRELVEWLDRYHEVF